jgi:hypothetical protein
MEEKKSFSIPMKWVDRIFDIMEEIYKEKWTHWHGAENVKGLYKMVWSHGLCGLTTDEIKNTITLLRNSSYSIQPPLVTDFYNYAKGITKPIHRKYVPDIKVNKELAKQAIAQIKNNLHGKRSTVVF